MTRAEAITILARRKAADDIRFGHDVASRDVHRKIPATARHEVKARLREIEAELRPTMADWELAYDVVAHGVVTS